LSSISLGTHDELHFFSFLYFFAQIIGFTLVDDCFDLMIGANLILPQKSMVVQSLSDLFSEIFDF
jgi:hypothetical protein